MPKDVDGQADPAKPPTSVRKITLAAHKQAAPIICNYLSEGDSSDTSSKKQQQPPAAHKEFESDGEFEVVRIVKKQSKTEADALYVKAEKTHNDLYAGFQNEAINKNDKGEEQVNHIPVKAFGEEKIDAQLRKVFVGGLPHNLEEKAFRGYFLKFGDIEDCVILQDKRTHRPRGFGFVTFKDILSVNAVLKMRNHHQIDGKWVDVKSAVPV